MTNKKNGLTEALDQYMADLPGTAIVSPEDLLAYEAGTLSSEKEAEVRVALLADPQALQRLEALQGLKAGDTLPDHPALREDDAEAAWAECQKRLPVEKPSSSSDTDMPPKGMGRILPFSLMAACLALAIWNLALVRENNRLSAPRLAPGITVHIPDPEVRAAPDLSLGLSEVAQTFTFRLPHAMRDFPRYRVEIVTPGGDPVTRLDREGPCETLVLSLTRDGFPHPGSFLIRLSGERDGRTAQLATCRLLVTDGQSDR